MTPIVTKQSLLLLLADESKRVHVIGRALVALFERQTASEQSSDATTAANNVGFAGSDARGGSLTAKSYMKNKTLAPWQVERWMRIGKNGFPRICKYANQLNDIAMEKRRKTGNTQLEALRAEYGMVVDSDDPTMIEGIARQLRALEEELGVEPYRIVGAVA